MIYPDQSARLFETEIFRGLPGEELKQIASTARRVEIKRHAYLFHQGEPAETFFIILDGTVRLSQLTPDGKQVIIHFFGPGDVIGLIVVLAGITYPLSAKAITPCVALGWDRVCFAEHMERCPGLAINAAQVVAARQAANPPATVNAVAPTPMVIQVAQTVGDLSTIGNLAVDRGMTEVGRECVDCHKTENPGIINDWKDSRHAHAGVTCIDCHEVEEDSPMATQHETLVGTDTFISVLVPPSTCARCHSAEAQQFNESGHFRAYRQIIPKDSLHALVNRHEGRDHPELSSAPGETGCMQCHGTEIQLDENNRPTADTWPNMGMGNVYPDGSTGNCATCHTRHKFTIAEARKPDACAACHLGPDHPDLEIFENSKHGHVYKTDSDDWIWNSAPDTWEPGDYRAPTCATCHMSGIGELNTTHNITERLYWNLWAARSEVRDSEDVMSPLLGNGEEGRAKMMLVCNSCHSALHTEGFFAQGDKAVELYNVAYYDVAEAWRAELEEKGLLKDNPWTDEFQIVYYYLWHHEGRRARQGAMMGGPDWAHWHGFFELQQDLYKLEEIYNKRIETGEIES